MKEALWLRYLARCSDRLHFLGAGCAERTRLGPTSRKQPTTYDRPHLKAIQIAAIFPFCYTTSTTLTIRRHCAYRSDLISILFARHRCDERSNRRDKALYGPETWNVRHSSSPSSQQLGFRTDVSAAQGFARRPQCSSSHITVNPSSPASSYPFLRVQRAASWSSEGTDASITRSSFN